MPTDTGFINVLPPFLTATELDGRDLPAHQTILDPILTGKSLALGIAWAAASGGSFLGWQAPRAHDVLYIDGEMAAADLQARLRQLGAVPPSLRFLLADVDPDNFGMPDLAQDAEWDELRRHWGRQPELLVLDNLASLVGTVSDNPDAWRHIQTALMRLRREGTAVLIVHHANKKGLQRGTSRREDVLDLVMALRRPDDYDPRHGARFELHFEKARSLYGAATDAIEARLTLDDQGLAKWHVQPAQASELKKVALMMELASTRARSPRNLPFRGRGPTGCATRRWRGD